MDLNGIELKATEAATLRLRGIYQERGYRKFKMSRFEEYSFYAGNEDFLKGDKVITFTDLDGRLMAMKPDVTLSIIKNSQATRENEEKFYYIENVFREDKEANNFREVSQMGLEYIGDLDNCGIAEVLSLAARSLNEISSRYVLEVSNMEFVTELLGSMNLAYEDYAHILELIKQKNSDGIRKIGAKSGLSEEKISALAEIPGLYGDATQTLARASQLVATPAMADALDDIKDILSSISEETLSDNIKIDFSIAGDIDYYNGIIFRGFIEGASDNVLAGGQYDRAMRLFGRNVGAIGFALYLDEIDRAQETDGDVAEAQQSMLNIALPKGRLGDQVYEIMTAAGYECPDYEENDRRLIIENQEAGIRYLLVKPSDVAVYVEQGAADVGIVGKDILMESEPDVYELLDLEIGKCRMCVAAPTGYEDDRERTLRVATKYVNVAKKYFSERNRDAKIVKLNGSIELGPILGMTDVIVDIVETGTTLRDNDLEIIDAFKDISARLIANVSSFKFKNEEISKLIEQLRK